jgi:hypothetical protein
MRRRMGMVMHRVMVTCFGHGVLAGLLHADVATDRMPGTTRGHRRCGDPLKRDRQGEDEGDEDLRGAMHSQSLVHADEWSHDTAGGTLIEVSDHHQSAGHPQPVSGEDVKCAASGERADREQP